MNDKPIALDGYEILAESYAAVVDTKPHNAYYERPATLSLLPDVKGKRVLDAACGPGVYSEWLLSHGAQVVAVDASPKMLELTRKRVGDAVDIRQADLRKPLILEPKPTEEFKAADPEDYEELMQQPTFLCLRARK